MSSVGGLIVLAVQRALATPQLLAIRFAGVLVAVTLVASVSLYSGAMGDAMLQQQIRIDPTHLALSVGLSNAALSSAHYAALDSYIRRGEAADIGVPLRAIHVHHNTATVPVYRLGTPGRHPSTAPLASLALDYYEGMQQHITLMAGTLDVSARMPDGDAPVLISMYTAKSLQLRIGDRLLYAQDPSRPIGPPLVVVGIFQPIALNSSFWDIHAGDATYRSLVTLHLDTFQIFAVHSAVFSPEYFWEQTATLRAIHLAAANAILAGIARARSTIAALAPGATLITTLDETINAFQDQYSLLPSILLILVAPIVAVILYAIAVTTALTLDRQAPEIVLMRSRGATQAQVLGIYFCEGVLLDFAALFLGPFIGLPLAVLIGRASGFLSFSGGLPFDMHLNGETYLDCAVTALLCLLVGLLPALSLARRPMTAFKSEQARPRIRPRWQRFYLDVVMLAIALYGLARLVQQGPVSSGDSTATVAQDPLIALAPLLFALAATLLLSRILPWLASLCLLLLSALSSPSAFMALQRVARTPSQPMRLVQLCALTLTLGIFAATVAGIQSRNLRDQYMYQAGAPLRLFESFDRQHAPANLQNTPDIMPLAAHLLLPGVHAVTPALRYESVGNNVNITDSGTSVNVLGVDPATAVKVMWYRADFAAQSFEHLLRHVDADGPNAIVSSSFLSATGLHQGDTFGVTLTNSAHLSFRIAAVAQYFPTLDPTEYPFVVSNLAYLERASRSHGPNEVWLTTDQSQTAIDRIVSAVQQWPRQIVSYEGLPPSDAAQGNPLSAGIYGVVSVGFLVAVALVLLGFIAYTYLTLQQRLAEVAVLRALGFSQGQVRSLLLFEEVFLLGMAMLGGIVTGVLTTRLFVPYLPIAAHVMPPFIVVMPWAAVGAFVLAVLVVFVLVLSVHVSLLLRVRLGQILRLGDA